MRTPFLVLLIAAFVLATTFGMPGIPANAEEAEPEIAAYSGILIDADTHEILFQKRPYERIAMASLTKIFTAYFALELGQLEQRLTVTESDLVGEASAGLSAGNNLSLETLLHGLMLASGNDAAMTIARNLGQNMPGSVDGPTGFLDYSNAQLPKLGIYDTHLANPHGLDENGHFSTAWDIALMTSLALKNQPDFLRISGSPGFSGEGFSFAQRNQLIGQYPGVISGKTGVTDDAGYSLMTVAQRDGRTLISVVLGSNDARWYADSIALLEYGFSLPASAPQATAQASTLEQAIAPVVTGLSVHQVNSETLSVRPDSATTASNAWRVIRWPIGAILAMLVASVTIVQTRALIRLHKLPAAKGRRPRPRRAPAAAPRPVRPTVTAPVAAVSRRRGTSPRRHPHLAPAPALINTTQPFATIQRRDIPVNRWVQGD